MLLTQQPQSADSSPGCEADHFHLGDFTFFRESIVIHHDWHAISHHDWSLGRKVQGNNWNVLQQMYCRHQVRSSWRGGRRGWIPLVHHAVVNVPQFWALILRVPPVVLVTERIDAFLGPTLFFITTGAPKSSIEFVLVESLLQPWFS